MKALSKTNKLKVALAWGPNDKEEVGFLAANSSGQIAFEFNTNFVSSHKSHISPFKLEDKRGLQFAHTERTPFEGLFGVFWDSLPDGWGILLMEHSPHASPYRIQAPSRVSAKEIQTALHYFCQNSTAQRNLAALVTHQP